VRLARLASTQKVYVGAGHLCLALRPEYLNASPYFLLGWEAHKLPKLNSISWLNISGFCESKNFAKALTIARRVFPDFVDVTLSCRFVFSGWDDVQHDSMYLWNVPLKDRKTVTEIAYITPEKLTELPGAFPKLNQLGTVPITELARFPKHLDRPPHWRDRSLQTLTHVRSIENLVIELDPGLWSREEKFEMVMGNYADNILERFTSLKHLGVTVHDDWSYMDSGDTALSSLKWWKAQDAWTNFFETVPARRFSIRLVTKAAATELAEAFLEKMEKACMKADSSNVVVDLEATDDDELNGAITEYYR
ncbi:hypothetical protein HDU93_005667, partial [Gonapodya sp. JEL0774]